MSHWNSLREWTKTKTMFPLPGQPVLLPFFRPLFNGVNNTSKRNLNLSLKTTVLIHRFMQIVGCVTVHENNEKFVKVAHLRRLLGYLLGFVSSVWKSFACNRAMKTENMHECPESSWYKTIVGFIITENNDFQNARTQRTVFRPKHLSFCQGNKRN